MKQSFARWQFLGAMGIFGSVGIFVQAIPLPSAAVAFARGLLGCLFLLGYVLLTGKRLSLRAVRPKLPLLMLSGAAVGFNWVLLFEAYRHTTVAVATVCYYLAPLFLLLASPLLGEKLTGKKLLCVGLALAGMVPVSGVLQTGLSGLTGIGFGVGAAVLYGSVMFMNKKLGPMPAWDKTLWQLGTATAVVLPYMLLTDGFPLEAMGPRAWVLLGVVGIVHTGVAYILYFGALGGLSAKSAAIFSYLDPALAILLSALVLRQALGPWELLGTGLILGSALWSELPERKTQEVPPCDAES